MALDAISRLIHRAREVRAGIGQAEALALPPVRRMQLKRRCAVQRNASPHGSGAPDRVCGATGTADRVRCLSRPAGESAAHAAYCAAMCRCSACADSSSSQRETWSTNACSVSGSPKTVSSFRARLGPSSAAAFSGVMPLAAFLKTKRRFKENRGASTWCRCCSSRNSGVIRNSSPKKSSRYGDSSISSSECCLRSRLSGFCRAVTTGRANRRSRARVGAETRSPTSTATRGDTGPQM